MAGRASGWGIGGSGSGHRSVAAGHRQAGVFGEAEQDVEVLHRGARGPLDQVVEAADQQDPAADNAGGDVAEVGVDRVFRAGQMIDDPDEPLLVVGLPEQAEHVGLGHALGRPGVDRGQDAAVHRGELGGEDHLGPAAGVAGEDLLDLGRVPVPADVVGRHALVALGKVGHQLRRPARPADAALGVDDDVGRVRPAPP